MSPTLLPFPQALRIARVACYIMYLFFSIVYASNTSYPVALVSDAVNAFSSEPLDVTPFYEVATMSMLWHNTLLVLFITVLSKKDSEKSSDKTSSLV
jgi:hypothetical protein